jgi:hypothetical protein
MSIGRFNLSADIWYQQSTAVASMFKIDQRLRLSIAPDFERQLLAALVKMLEINI